MIMALIDQIEEFNSTMDKIVELVEECKTLAKEIPDVSISEAPAKVKSIYDMCADSKSSLDTAIGQAEEIQKTLGG
jgi:hypothetical protein